MCLVWALDLQTSAPSTLPRPHECAVRLLSHSDPPILWQVRGVAVPLCAAFAIPDHILRAPIGLATGQEDLYSEVTPISMFVSS